MHGLRDMHDIGMISCMNTNHEWVPNDQTFAARLALVRHEMDWNLKEAALACGLRPQSWREWELTDRKPRDYEAVCKKIANRTAVSLVWLMTGQALTPTPAAAHPTSRKGEVDTHVIFSDANQLLDCLAPAIA